MGFNEKNITINNFYFFSFWSSIYMQSTWIKDGVRVADFEKAMMQHNKAIKG